MGLRAAADGQDGYAKEESGFDGVLRHFGPLRREHQLQHLATLLHYLARYALGARPSDYTSWAGVGTADLCRNWKPTPRRFRP